MEECPICTKPILTNIDNVKTPCGHAFCFSCIIKWIVENSSTCPLCRTNIYQKSIEPKGRNRRRNRRIRSRTYECRFR